MTESQPIPGRVRGQADFERLRPQFLAHGEYTYRLFEEFEFGDVDLTQSIFTGALWRAVKGTRTVFTRSDFDGMQVEQCEFEEADFSNADIRSTAFAGCLFRFCRFEGALLDSCSFDRCLFEGCSFESSVQRASTYSGCELSGLTMTRSSVTKCRFYHSRMHSLMLADCTFLYVITRDCELDDITVNVESIGTVFGLSRRDLSKLNFVHLGRVATPTDTADLGDLLVRTFESQRWSLSLAITRINFSLTSVAFAIGTYLREVEVEVQNGRRLRYEELAFLLDVFSALFDEQRLPMVSLSQLADVIHASGGSTSGTADQRLTTESNRDLIARTSALVHSSLDRLAASFGNVDLADDRTLWIEFRFEAAPRLQLPSFLEQATKSAGLLLTQTPARTAARTGSYIEIVQMCMATALALQLLLYLLNGMVIQLTELKERVRVLRQRRAPETFQILARTGRQPLPASLRRPLRELLTFVSSHGLTSQPDLDGVDERNLKSVQVVDSPDGSTDDEGTTKSDHE